MSGTISILEVEKWHQARERLLEAEILEAQAKVREAQAQATDMILGCTQAQFLVGMEIIMRDTRKPFPEAFALWKIHAAECAQERKAEARANSSMDDLRAALGAWVMEGMPRKKAICTCADWDCPTKDLTYVMGRGFVDRYVLEEEAEAAAPKTWAQRVKAGR
jgi:hypothetical protein